jgi:hypothetical protein
LAVVGYYRVAPAVRVAPVERMGERAVERMGGWAGERMGGWR